MNVVAATHDLNIGGSQGYLLLVAEQLERLGHSVILHTPEREGPLADLASERGVRVARVESALPSTCDAILVQDGIMAHRLAAVYPNAPQVFQCSSELFDLQLPPQLPDLVATTIALSERVAQRLRALAVTTDVVRLTQPVDTSRFSGGESLSERPRRAVLLGNYLQAARRDLLIDAWESEGIECVVVGNHGEPTLEPERAIADADIVVAKGRAALEGMACGRAVYVYDQFGCDGWVTPESYPSIEADNFAGLASAALPSPQRLIDDLADYDPGMGMRNRDLAVLHHCPRRHGEAIARLVSTAAPRAEPAGTPYTELARLVRMQWQAESRGFGLAVDNRSLLARTHELEEANGALHARASKLEAERDAAISRARKAESRITRLNERRGFRVAVAIKRAGDSLRRAAKSR